MRGNKRSVFQSANEGTLIGGGVEVMRTLYGVVPESAIFFQR